MKWLRFSPLLFFFNASADGVQQPAIDIECQERRPSPQLYVKVCRYDFNGDSVYEIVTSHVERDDNKDGLVDYIEDCQRNPDYSLKECAIGYADPNIVKVKYPVEL